MATQSVSDRAIASARELRRVFKEADDNGYGLGAWYFYMNRRDIEVVVEAVIGPESKEQQEIFTLTIAGVEREVTKEQYNAILGSLS